MFYFQEKHKLTMLFIMFSWLINRFEYALKILSKITLSIKGRLIQSIKKLTQKDLYGNFEMKRGNYKISPKK